MSRDSSSSKRCYVNGAWVDDSALALSVDDFGVVQGIAVSERLRTFAGKIFRLDDHLGRLERSLEIIGMPSAAVRSEVETVLPEVAARNRVDLEVGDDLGLTLFVTPGLTTTSTEGSAEGPTLCIFARPIAFGAYAEKYAVGERLVVSSYRQVPPECWPPELKCRSRMHYFLADRAAAECEPGARAVLLDEAGHVCEASTSNVLIVRDGRIESPRLEKILPGVSLAMVEELAGELAIPFSYGDITADGLRAADEILLASTSPCIVPVTACDGKPTGGGKPGPIFHRLIEAWGQHVGVDIIEQARAFAKRPGR